VAGIIGAQGNNATGTAGVNWHVTIMPVKFLGPEGGDDFSGAQAIEYAVDHGANVINCSWGGGGTSDVLDEAIAYAGAHNVLIVCAAGNDGTNNDQEPFFPASSPATNVITVAATDRNDELADFSNYGQDSVDLAAPGVDVTSTLPAEPSGLLIDSAPSKVFYLPVQAESLEPASARDAIITRAVSALGEATATPILVVDDSSAASMEETQGVRLGVYTNALSAAGFSNVDTWVTDSQGTPAESDMRGKIVVWFTGKTSGYWNDTDACVNDAEQAVLGSYLDDGGRLVMLSGEMATDLSWFSEDGSDFLFTYFHATLADLATWGPGFTGKPATPFAGIQASLPTAVMDDPSCSDSIYPIGDGTTTTQITTSLYGPLSGTSMAAPHVTGAVALLKAAYPTASSDELQARILNTVDAKPSLDGKVAFGGRLDLAAAMTSYPGRPTITAPKAGDRLHATQTSTLQWRRAAGGSSSATYTAEIGLPYTVWGTGFEDASLSDFSPETSSSANWTITSEATKTHAGAYAAKSGDPGPSSDLENTFSGMQTTVTVPAGGATLSFWWKMDGPDDASTISGFYVDEGSISEALWYPDGWVHSTFELPVGEHVLHWEFLNYGLGSVGDGSTCVDDITLTAHAFSPLGTADAGQTSLDFTVPTTNTADAWVRVRSNLDGVSSAWAYVKGMRISTDLVAPGAPTSLTASHDSDGHVNVSWDNPVDSDFTATRVLWSEDATPTGPEDPDATVAYEGTGTATVIGSLVHGSHVHIGAFATDASGNWSAEASASTTVVDTTGPDPVAFLTGRHRASGVTLSWTPPLGTSYDRVKVLARTDSTPTVDDTRAVTVFSGRAATTIDATAYPKTVKNVYYSVYATDVSGNASSVRSVRVAVDAKPPAGYISLNDDDMFSSSAMVGLHSEVTSATEMRIFTNGEDDPEALWQPFSADTIVPLLPLDGLQSVTVQFRNAEGDILVTDASIYIDLLAPDALQHITASASGAGVLLGWTVPWTDMSLVSYRVDQAPTASGPWATVAEPYAEECMDGTYYVGNLRPATQYYYRVYAIDAVGHVGVATATVPVTTNAVRVSTPSAPSKAKKNRKFTVSAVIFPTRSIGSHPARFLCYRYEHGKWKLRKTVSARAASYRGDSVVCSAKFALTAGKWRISARDVSSGVTSGMRAVTVR
jgi:subtilisin family serine protease